MMVGTIDIKGLYKASMTLPNPNSVRVTATSTAEPSVAATVPVTLENPNPIPKAGSAISYQLTTGHNFAIGTNLKAKGFPGAFPAGLTTGYLDIGAAQRQEAGAGGQHAAGFQR
jgi:hypothetical protein